MSIRYKYPNIKYLYNLAKFSCLDEEIWFNNLFRRAVWALHIHKGPEEQESSLQSSCQDLSPGARLLQARNKRQLFCNALCFKNSEMCLFLIKVEWPTGSWNLVAMMYQGKLLKFHSLASVQVLNQNFWEQGKGLCIWTRYLGTSRSHQNLTICVSKDALCCAKIRNSSNFSVLKNTTL